MATTWDMYDTYNSEETNQEGMIPLCCAEKNLLSDRCVFSVTMTRQAYSGTETQSSSWS